MTVTTNAISKLMENFNAYIYFDVITRFDSSLQSISIQQGQAENDDDDDENHVLIKKCVIGRQKELGSSQMRGSPSSPMYPAYTAAQLLPAIAH